MLGLKILPELRPVGLKILPELRPADLEAKNRSLGMLGLKVKTESSHVGPEGTHRIKVFGPKNNHKQSAIVSEGKHRNKACWA